MMPLAAARSHFPSAARILLLALLVLSFTMTACKPGVPVLQFEAAQASKSPVLLGVASVFMKIENSGAADSLIAARIDVPGAIVELHDIRDGKMVSVDSIEIPARDTVVLRPARQHIMVLNLPKDVKDGFKFKVTLLFKRSGEKTIPLELTPFTPGSSTELRS